MLLPVKDTSLSMEAIGRPRQEGNVAPEPSARPKDVVALERSFGMSGTI
jgi:hypothetical protein